MDWNRNRIGCLALCSTIFAVEAKATDWTVDDDGGVGVDFTRVVDAVAVANHGDRIFVSAGVYPDPIDSSVGVSIIGSGSDARLSSAYRWHDLPPGRELRIVNVALGSLVLEQCDGAVIVTEVDMTIGGRLVATGCIDVRLSRTDINTVWPVALTVQDSRVELVDCDVTGSYGSSSQLNDGSPGGTAVEVLSGGLLTVANSDLLGGRGGDSITGGVGLLAGDGGTGAFVDVGGSLVVVGGSHRVIRGGDGGVGPDFQDDGAGGVGLHVEGEVSLSGAVAYGGESVDWVDGLPITGSGTVFQPIPDEPSLELIGAAIPGETIHFTVRGTPGELVVLMVGRAPSVAFLPGLQDPLLTQPVRQFPLGFFNGSGRLVHSITLPLHLQPGQRFVFQARIEGGPALRLTNSAPIVVH